MVLLSLQLWEKAEGELLGGGFSEGEEEEGEGGSFLIYDRKVWPAGGESYFASLLHHFLLSLWERLSWLRVVRRFG